MRLLDLHRTTSFRLALLFLLLFGATSLTLFGFLYVQTSGHLRRQVNDWLRREQASFTQLDREAYLVYKKGVKVVLAKKEFELLYLLASKPGKVYTREVILKNIWEDSVVVTNRTIDVHVRKLREKLGDDCVSTVKGVGYKFEA